MASVAVAVDLRALFARAHAAGKAAGDGIVPRPMHVVERANPFDGASTIVRRYEPVMDGVCGFAWVNIKPGNSPAAKLAVAEWGARKSHEGGVTLWVSDYNQSMTRKEAYAMAFAVVLREGGIRAYANSRMD